VSSGRKPCNGGHKSSEWRPISGSGFYRIKEVSGRVDRHTTGRTAGHLLQGRKYFFFEKKKLKTFVS
jgi:hypothetical protein